MFWPTKNKTYKPTVQYAVYTNKLVDFKCREIFKWWKWWITVE